VTFRTGTLRAVVPVTVSALLVLASCSDDSWLTQSSPPSASPAPNTTAPGPRYDAGDVRFDSGVVASSHDCVPTDGRASIAWSALRNPIYEEAGMTANQTVRHVDGRWHMYFSSVEPGGMGYATSTDWSDWQRTEPRPDEGGAADLTRGADGSYVLAHQVHDDRPVPDSRKVVTRAAADLSGLATAEPVRIAPGIYDDERSIDGALAHTTAGVFAIFKRGLRDAVPQVTTLVHSPTGSLDGPWVLVGDVESVGWFENDQFLTIDGKWHLLGTSIPFHDPMLYRMEGDPARPHSWLDWKKVRVLDIPQEAWNAGPRDSRGFSHDVANTAFLCDARTVDGYFYVFYSGATELESNDGRGHQKIGVARSTDLESWQVPRG
jgi:hypothetical protein